MGQHQSGLGNINRLVDPKMHLYLTSRSESEKQLVEAECAAMTGASPDERGIALAEVEADVSRKRASE